MLLLVYGNQPATLRALFMFYVILGAKVTGRSYDPLSSMSLSFILLLAENHCYLFTVDFSFPLLLLSGRVSFTLSGETGCKGGIVFEQNGRKENSF